MAPHRWAQSEGGFSHFFRRRGPRAHGPHKRPRARSARAGRLGRAGPALAEKLRKSLPASGPFVRGHRVLPEYHRSGSVSNEYRRCVGDVVISATFGFGRGGRQEQPQERKNKTKQKKEIIFRSVSPMPRRWCGSV